MNDEEVPSKRRKSLDTNTARCIICQEDTNSKKVYILKAYVIN